MLKYQKVMSEDVYLNVVTEGDINNPAILFIHGFPDSHRTWNRQFEGLSDKYFVISFDFRGVGESTCSNKKNAYYMTSVVDDVARVLESVLPANRKVHIVGHDWGSVVGWSFITHPEYKKRVASWTSISGPHIGLFLDWMRRKLVSGKFSDFKLFASQFTHSWYVMFIQVPGAVDLGIKTIGRLLWRPALRMNGVNGDDEIFKESSKQVQQDMLNSVELYRDNLFSPPPLPEKGSIDIPTQLVIAEKDMFILPPMFEYLGEYVNNLTIKHIRGKHWVHRSQSKTINQYISDFVTLNTEKPLVEKT